MKTTRVLLPVLAAMVLAGLPMASPASTVYTESFEGTLDGSLSGSIDQVKVFDDTAYLGQSTDVAHGAPSGPLYHFLVFNGNSVGGLDTSHDATGGSFTSTNFNTLNGGSYTLTFDYGMFNGAGPQMLTVTATDSITSSALLTQNPSDGTSSTAAHGVTSPYSYSFTGSGNPVFLTFLDTTTNLFQNDGVLDYIVVTGPLAPEPASLTLLGVGSLLALRRRRR